MPLRLTTATPRLTYWKEQTTFHIFAQTILPATMSPHPKSSSFYDTLMSGVSRLGMSHREFASSPSEGTQGTSRACTDGRLYDWQALQEGSEKVQTAYTELCAIKNEVADASALSDTTRLDTLKPKLDKWRLTLSGTLAALNHRLAATQPTLNLPTQWEIENREPGEMGKVDAYGDETMSKPFWQMMEGIRRSEKPCDSSRMTALTAHNPLFKNLNMALTRREGKKMVA
jgi:hypothetical protein